MTDYISRVDALSQNLAMPYIYNVEESDAFFMAYYQYWNILANLPAADVVERKTGKMMHEHLVKNLRDDTALQNCEFDFVHAGMHEAADAIEELEKENEKLHDDLGKAIRKLTKKHGEWKEVKISDGFGYFTIYKDSECGYEVSRKTNYCPWCGAKMKMEEDDE